MFLSIIIPAYNEEQRISGMLKDYLAFYQHEDVEFIVALNSCSDNTSGIVRSFVESEKGRVRMIETSEAIGKGGAVRWGFEVAKGEYIAFVDADEATEPGEFDRVLKVAVAFDGAIASRWKRGSKIIHSNFIREVISICFIALVKVLFWMPFVDTQCGAKIFKREVVKTVLPELNVINMAFDVELLFRVHRHGFRVIEVPTRWFDKSDTSASLGSPLKLIRTSFKMFFTLLQIRFSK